MPLTPDRPIRVVFCWTDVSGYMSACWRELAADPRFDIHVLYPELLLKENPFRKDGEMLRGVSNELFNTSAPDVDALLLEKVTARRPDIVVICGWLYWPYARLVQSARLRDVRIIVGMDSPWRGALTQRLARVRLAPLVRRLDAIVTAGERSRQYARRLGVAEHRIHTGFYGFDYATFSRVAEQRSERLADWPRQFLYVGRYVPAKDLGTLARGYSQYRRSVSEPWGLTCCGWGDESRFLKDVPGLVDVGFTPPAALPAMFARHGAFVLPSRFEPWGVVIAEAAASGLPVVCTTACGSGDEVVRDYYSGVTVAPGDVDGLARALRWIHDHPERLREMGMRGRSLAASFSAQAWTARWREYFFDVMR